MSQTTYIILFFSHIIAIGIGVFIGAWHTAPFGEETSEGFVELETHR